MTSLSCLSPHTYLCWHRFYLPTSGFSSNNGAQASHKVRLEIAIQQSNNWPINKQSHFQNTEQLLAAAAAAARDKAKTRWPPGPGLAGREGLVSASAGRALSTFSRKPLGEWQLPDRWSPSPKSHWPSLASFYCSGTCVGPLRHTMPIFLMPRLFEAQHVKQKTMGRKRAFYMFIFRCCHCVCGLPPPNLRDGEH